MAPDPRTLRKAYLAWVAVCIIWGTTYLGIRIALESIPPALVGALRYIAAGLIMAVILAARGEKLPARTNWPGLALLGFLMIVLGNGGVIWAEQWVPSGIAAVIVASTPFWSNGIEALLPGGERITRAAILGLALGFSGILMLVWPDLTAGGASGRQFVLGVVAIQVASIGWSLGSVYSRRHARDQNAFSASALQMLFGGLMMAAIATVRGEWQMLAFTPRTFWAEVYLAIVGSVVGFTAYIYALKHLPISTVSLYTYVNPVIAVLAGTLFADEPFGWRAIVASAMVYLGILTVRRGDRASGPKPQGSGQVEASEAS